MRMRKWCLAAAAAALVWGTAGCGRAQTGNGSGERGQTAAAQMEDGQAETEQEEPALEGDKTEPLSKNGSEPATEGETAPTLAVGTEGMEPVYPEALADGEYDIQVDSSSSMFRITDCRLTVADGAMKAVMTMSGKGYGKVYLGTKEEAETAPETDWIPYVENQDGAHTFEVPVAALDMEIPCSAFSKKKEQWYDRTLVFRSDSLPAEAFGAGGLTTAASLGLENGMYQVEVSLDGGSGRTTVESPASLRVEDGNAFATIVWSSPNYDYMKVDGEKYLQINEEGNSAFEIPVSAFDRRLSVAADTIAMSVPHEIEYTLTFHSGTLQPAEGE